MGSGRVILCRQKIARDDYFKESQFQNAHGLQYTIITVVTNRFGKILQIV